MPPQPAPATVPAVFENGVVSCPCCTGSGVAYAGVPALMRHITRSHQGTTLTEGAASTLRLLERGVCCNSACGGFRRLGVRQCNRCGQSTSVRPPAAGDVVPGTLGTRGAASQSQQSTQAPPPSQHQPSQSDVQLPADFTRRVRALPPQTLVHTPVAARARCAKVWAECLEGLNEGLPGWSASEEARPKLLLMECVPGAHFQTELSRRLRLWEDRDFEGLLSSLEAQRVLRSQKPRRRQKANAATACSSKTRRMVAEGAYRKALNNLTSSVAAYTAAEQKLWAHKLLPKSDTPSVALAPHRAPPAAVPRPNLRVPAGAADDEQDHPLKGVRYSALTAPGPSGARPEHAKEMLGIRRRPLARRLLRALGEVHSKAAAGTLGDHARWLLRTRLVYLEKKGSTTPRPVRIGEFLRTSFSKKLVKTAAAGLRPKLLDMHQWGVCMPGGAEALVHWRDTLEELALSGQVEALVAFDLDLQNMFGSVEWPCIREAMNGHFQAAAAWTEWAHQQPAVIQLPSGEEVAQDRGAEQGDPFGSAQASLALGDKVKVARTQFSAAQAGQQHGHGTGACDEWFIDDGQTFVRPHLADLWLRTLDRALAFMGATRSVGEHCKSVARLLCPSSEVQQHTGWDTSYIRDSCKVLPGTTPAKVLGVKVASAAAANDMTKDTIDKVEHTRAAVAGLQDAPTELVLTRRCLDVSKVGYSLRCVGDRISDEVAARFDKGLRTAVEDTLAGELSDESWLQATLGVSASGLGLRDSATLLHPAFVASRIVSKPLVMDMAAHAVDAGFLTLAEFEDHYDQRTMAAVDKLRASLPPGLGNSLQVLLEDAVADAAARWAALKAGGDGAGAPSAAAGRVPAGGLVADTGVEDPEHPAGRAGSSALQLQAKLTALADDCVAEGLLQSLRQGGRWSEERRIQEISHPDCSHDWLWAVDPHKGPTLSQQEYVTAVRLRLGGGGLEEPVLCSNCGEALLDTAAAHALCCARGPSTKGHYKVRDEVLALARISDSSAETEPEGLIASQPTLRPADILSSTAISGCLAALDVGIVAPEASGAGSDCTESMHRVKAARYASYTAELERENVKYQPLVWSAFGRPHPQTALVLARLAKKGARRQGLLGSEQILRRANARIGLEIWRRAARMVMGCLPRAQDDDEVEQSGNDAEQPLGKSEPPGVITGVVATNTARN
jgi:hypothetical protein